MTLSQTLIWLTQHLPPEEAKQEATLMLSHACGMTRTQLRTYPEKTLTDAQKKQLQTWLSRRQQGEPLAYILGNSEFYGLTLRVTPATLIPRQDTELLVDAALERIPENSPWNILDMGTGSGAIAIAIAQHRPLVQITALDFSATALAVAQDNACALRLAHIRFLHSNWFEALAEQTRFNLIVSNPPYIADNDTHLTQTSLPHEPITALTSGVDGLDAIRHLIQQAPRWLTNSGWLLLEHGYNQGPQVQALLQLAGFSNIATHRDYGNNERITLGQWITHE